MCLNASRRATRPARMHVPRAACRRQHQGEGSTVACTKERGPSSIWIGPGRSCSGLAAQDRRGGGRRIQTWSGPGGPQPPNHDPWPPQREPLKAVSGGARISAKNAWRARLECSLHNSRLPREPTTPSSRLPSRPGQLWVASAAPQAPQTGDIARHVDQLPAAVGAPALPGGGGAARRPPARN